MDMDLPLQLAPAPERENSGKDRSWTGSSAWQAATRCWMALHKELKQIWSVSRGPPAQIAKRAVFMGELGRWGSGEGKPHGLGALLLEDMQHLGSFREGRADGEGMCFSRSGCVWHGSWSQNLRVGDFLCLDARGHVWLEQYDRQGKRYGRKLAQGFANAGDLVKPAARCEECGWLHHLSFESHFSIPTFQS